ncbi:NAD(P)H-dependent oxidoreductase [Pseudonocardia adelaidensis]|uniref:NAD(P)H-dependent oxidoreductase n=1 Tax=Pseudonocardia adelaidensis TaxID=648754 RepID=A0ABP9N995_9PSEU
MPFVARLLIVHHTPSPATAELLDAVVRGASDPEITGVDVVRRAALAATASDLLAADAVVLGTPANIGYMSGALKHFFDTVYYVCRDDTRGLPYGCYVHGNLGVEGAVRAIGSITDGMGWTRAAAPVEVMGAPDKAALDACYELGAVLAAGVAPEGS